MIGWVIVLFLVLGAVLFGYRAVYAFLDAYKSIVTRSWKVTNGKMLEFDENIFDLKEDEEIGLYSYTVDEEVFKGHLIGYGIRHELNKLERLYLDLFVYKNYPDINVYYNSENPEESVLVVGFPLYIVGKGIICLFASSFILMLAWFMVNLILTKGSS